MLIGKNRERMKRPLQPGSPVAKKRLSNDVKYALNSVCPYFTMFPLEYPLSILKRYSGRRLRVLDPFCGRGTTVFASRLRGHEAFGIDSSPVATAIARAKMAECEGDEVMELAKEILAGGGEREVPKGAFWNWAFDQGTLRQVCSLREGLQGRSSDAANLLRAVCLGALHGPLTKDKDDPSYFSNQMPRTFAPKPGYSVGYWKQHKLRPRVVDASYVIRKRVERLALPSSAGGVGKSRIHTADSRRCRGYAGFPEQIDLVITSPPYYGMRTYLADQWLRNWFLGGESDVPYGEKTGLSHQSPEAFAGSLAAVWNRVGALLKPGGRMYVRFGAIPSRKGDARAIMRRSLEMSLLTWGVQRVRCARSADFGKRQAGQMGSRVKSVAIEEHDFEIVLASGVPA